jgi:hypothetical protein
MKLAGVTQREARSRMLRTFSGEYPPYTRTDPTDATFLRTGIYIVPEVLCPELSSSACSTSNWHIEIGRPPPCISDESETGSDVNDLPAGMETYFLQSPDNFT